jgi:ankyrin repeat protein
MSKGEFDKVDNYIYKSIKSLKSTTNEDHIDKIKNKLVDYIKKTPDSLYIRQSTFTPYIYAASLNLNTLMIFHSIYEHVSDSLPDVYVEPFEYKNKNGDNLIHYVVNSIIHKINSGGNKYDIKQLFLILEYVINTIGVNIDSFDKNRNTVLQLASKYNKIDIVKFLLFYGADPNIIDADFKTPLNYSVINKNFELFKILLYKKANYKYARKESNYPLFLQIVEQYKKKINRKIVNGSKKYTKEKHTQYLQKKHLKLCSNFYNKDNNINDDSDKINNYKKELKKLANELHIEIPKNTNDNADDEIYNNLCKLISHKILIKKSLKKVN